METMQTVRLRWQRGMCRERTSTVKLAGGFPRIYLKAHEQVGKLARLIMVSMVMSFVSTCCVLHCVTCHPKLCG